MKIWQHIRRHRSASALLDERNTNCKKNRFGLLKSSRGEERERERERGPAGNTFGCWSPDFSIINWTMDNDGMLSGYAA